MTAKDNAMPTSQSNALKLAALCALSLTAGLTARPASATLGEPEVSVQADVAQLHGAIKASTLHGVYNLHEIQLPSGTLLREYVSLNGNVFAVAWSGPSPPDLRQTFGKYFDSFVSAAQQHRGDRNHLQIQQSDLVIQVRGHMRGTFSGRAYLPTVVPAGVNLGDLQ
jgi:hypothetical protein